jgi:hypothetical protein
VHCCKLVCCHFTALLSAAVLSWLDLLEPK